MASFRFYYRGKKEKGKVSVRLIHNSLDCTISTPYYTLKEYWIYKTTKNGKSTYKHKTLDELKGGAQLKQHKENLIGFRERLERQLITDVNEGLPITNEWLKSAVKKHSTVLTSQEEIFAEQQKLNKEKTKKEEIEKKNNLLNAIESIFLKYKTNNKELKKFKTTYNWVVEYQLYKNNSSQKETKFQTKNFNQGFIDDFKDWAVNEMKYKLSTAVGHLKRIKRAIKYAESIEDEGIVKLHRTINDLNFVTTKEQEQQEDKIVVRLTFDEFDKIDDLDFDDDEVLKEVQKCMLIGGETGLRFSDFGKLNNDNLKTTLGGVEYWEFKTSKTKKWVQITKTERLEYFLDKYGDPKTDYSDNEDILLNEKMKVICKKAKINESIEMEISKIINVKGKETRRYVRGFYPKYKGITTRTLRRSFATNYYGLMDTELIMRVTGHTDVKSLREYINVHDDKIVAISYEKINKIHKDRALKLKKVE
ncbi:tyrosine-type recombinase/integrase [Mesonia sp. K7]|uniref:tyrosine-type recombinase/integrase n=1 Tax=Mesonia sp. K7 TaxID=2218606 RepID=UPI000DA7691E|nr:tyrosine-type recombinase/integrase [Mesonia sp. K7]PZD79662.1 hypothetical protein DNG35_01255 [Mesonia sp. K7]